MNIKVNTTFPKLKLWRVSFVRYIVFVMTLVMFTPFAALAGGESDEVNKPYDASDVNNAVLRASKESVLGETYFELYDLYEVRLEGDEYFYTNVRNGDIVDKIVKFDLPEGMYAVLEKDGEPAEFINRGLIADVGTYSMKIYVGDYYGLFRFRIQKRPSAYEETPFDTDFSQYTEYDFTDEEAFSEFLTSIQEEPVFNPEPEPILEDKNVRVGFSEEYDSELGIFTYTTPAGRKISMDKPNGIITTEKMTLSVPEETTYQITRDDEPFDLPENGVISLPGKYHLAFYEPEYKSAYYHPPELSFRIIPQYVNDLKIYYPPNGFEITDAEKFSEDYEFSPERVMFSQDGYYQITLASLEYPDVIYKFDFNLDTQPPSVSLINVSDGVSTSSQVNVEYHSDDIDIVEFIKDGERLDRFDRYVISDAGYYNIHVYDSAGNISRNQFQMNYKMNTAVYIVIAAVLAIVIGAVAYFTIVNRDTRVV